MGENKIICVHILFTATYYLSHEYMSGKNELILYLTGPSGYGKWLKKGIPISANRLTSTQQDAISLRF